MAINFKSLEEAWEEREKVDEEYQKEKKKAEEEVSNLVKRYLENNRRFTVELDEGHFDFVRLFCIEIEIEGLPLKLQFTTSNKAENWEYMIGCKQINASFYFVPRATAQGQLDISFVCKTKEEIRERREKIML